MTLDSCSLNGSGGRPTGTTDPSHYWNSLALDQGSSSLSFFFYLLLLTFLSTPLLLQPILFLPETLLQSWRWPKGSHLNNLVVRSPPAVQLSAIPMGDTLPLGDGIPFLEKDPRRKIRFLKIGTSKFF